MTALIVDDSYLFGENNQSSLNSIYIYINKYMMEAGSTRKSWRVKGHVFLQGRNQRTTIETVRVITDTINSVTIFTGLTK